MTGDEFLDEIGDYGAVAKEDYREVWLRVCRDELAAAKERALIDAAIGRHPTNEPEGKTCG